MFICYGIYVSLCQTHINDMHDIRFVSETHQEIVWFDVSMYKTLTVHVLKTFDELNSQHQSSLEGEFVATKLEQICETRAHQLHCHEVGIVLLAITIDLGETFYILHVLAILPFILNYLVIDVM